MKGYTLTALFLLGTFLINAQVLIGEPPKIEKTTRSKQKNKQQKDTSAINSTTAIYLVSNWSSSTRSLTENDGYFGEPLGNRASESALNTWSFGLGLRSAINKHISWDGGISFIQNGEQNNYALSDTIFSYKMQYKYIAMPLRINYSVSPFKNNRVVFYAGVGLLPQMFFRYRYDAEWKFGDKSGSESLKTSSGYNSFVVSALFNIGVTVKINSKWGCIIAPEARIQFNSTYEKNSGYIHKNKSYGVTFGLTRNI